MDFILYIIFIFTLLLIIISVNEYFESCTIKTCLSNFGLLTDSTGKTSCTLCADRAENKNVATFATDSKCTPVTCKDMYSLLNNICTACNISNAKDYTSDGKICKVNTCLPGYYPDSDMLTCTKCTNATNVFTYKDPADNICGINLCNPGYKVTGTDINQNCKNLCDNSTTGVDNTTTNPAGYLSAYDQPVPSIEISNVPKL